MSCKQISVRVVTYNVAGGKWATPEQIGEAINPLHPDVIFLNEVPKPKSDEFDLCWSSHVAKVLGLSHIYEGKARLRQLNLKRTDISGIYHPPCVESIISRTPFTNTHEFKVRDANQKSSIGAYAETVIEERKVSLYALHLRPSKVWESSQHRDFMKNILSQDRNPNIIIGGDFNRYADNPIMQRLFSTAKLRNALQEDYSGLRRLVDHILYNRFSEVRVTQCGRNWGPRGPSKGGYLSDHPYAWAELLFPNPNLKYRFLNYLRSRAPQRTKRLQFNYK